MKITRPEKLTFGAIGTITYLSGLTLFILSWWVRVPSPIGEQHHPLEEIIRITHSSLTYIIVLTMGYLIKGHVFLWKDGQTWEALWDTNGSITQA